MIDVLDLDDLHITEKTTARDVEGWDSLSHLSLITEIEAVFGVTFLTGDIERFKNVGDMVSTVRNQIEASLIARRGPCDDAGEFGVAACRRLLTSVSRSRTSGRRLPRATRGRRGPAAGARELWPGPDPARTARQTARSYADAVAKTRYAPRADGPPRRWHARCHRAGPGRHRPSPQSAARSRHRRLRDQFAGGLRSGERLSSSGSGVRPRLERLSVARSRSQRRRSSEEEATPRSPSPAQTLRATVEGLKAWVPAGVLIQTVVPPMEPLFGRPGLRPATRAPTRWSARSTPKIGEWARARVR